MQYVKVYGKNHKEAMANLKQKYGDEILIRSESVVKPKTLFKKIFQKEKYLISAAIPQKEEKSPPPPSTPTQTQFKSNHNNNEEVLKSFRSHLQSAESTTSKNTPSSFAKVYQNVSNTKQDTSSHTQKNSLEELQKDVHIIKTSIEKNFSTVNNSIFKGELQKAYEFLQNQEISKVWSIDFVNNLKLLVPENQWNNPQTVKEKTKELLANYIKTSSLPLSKKGIAIVGPTGVGKTTNIAKIAQRLKFQKGLSVHFVTIDNFRIAATQQLKIYADIMDIPFSICKTPDELQNKMKEISEQVVLIDTTGFSPYNTEQLKKQQAFFQAIQGYTEIILMLAATSKPKDSYDTLSCFQKVGKISNIILSKLDETNTYGNFLEFADKNQLNFLFFSVGQNVPEDLENANSLDFANKIVQSY